MCIVRTYVCMCVPKRDVGQKYVLVIVVVVVVVVVVVMVVMVVVAVVVVLPLNSHLPSRQQTTCLRTKTRRTATLTARGEDCPTTPPHRHKLCKATHIMSLIACIYK